MKNQFRIFISSVQDEFATERKLLKKWLTTDPFVSRFVERVWGENVGLVRQLGQVGRMGYGTDEAWRFEALFAGGWRG